jgi:phosphatidylglycerophosphate synthase
LITPKEIEEKTMSTNKRSSARNDIFAFYIGRPLSYVLTIPFLYTNITPNAISIISIVPLILGFIFANVGTSKMSLINAWLCLFIWFLLDGVDGNVARYKKIFSKMGGVYDAMSGYIAMVLSFFQWGVAASHNPGIFQGNVNLPVDSYIILGALSGLFQIFPRLVMHKALNTIDDAKNLSKVKNKSEYGIVKIIALNITSIAGFVLLFMLIAILTNMLDLFTVIYFFINMMFMIASLYSIFRIKG